MSDWTVDTLKAKGPTRLGLTYVELPVEIDPAFYTLPDHIINSVAKRRKELEREVKKTAKELEKDRGILK